MDKIVFFEPELRRVTTHGDPPMPHLDQSYINRKFLNVAYGSKNDDQALDIYLPETGEGPFPTVIFFHGGAFWGGDKEDVQCIYALDGLFRGYAVVSVDYTSADDAGHPTPLQDCKAAIRYLRANAKKYKLDPDKFAVMGDSAGAYLAAMIGTTPDNLAFVVPDQSNPEISEEVQAVVGLFGVYDLEAQSIYTEKQKLNPDPTIAKLDNFADIYAGISCSEYPAFAKMLYPGTYVTANCPPFLIQGGTEDEIVPYEASYQLANVINEICGEERAVFMPMEGAHHGDPMYGSPENEDVIFAFLDRVLK